MYPGLFIVYTIGSEHVQICSQSCDVYFQCLIKYRHNGFFRQFTVVFSPYFENQSITDDTLISSSI